MPRTVLVEGKRITLDLLLWRAYGVAGNTSAMLRLALKANPGLAARGAVIPLRTLVTLPDLPAASARATRRPVNLFED